MYKHPNLPKALRAICKTNDLSQSQLAALAGVSTATIRKMLNGEEVKLTAIVGIATGLDMTASEFMHFLDELDKSNKMMSAD